MTHIQDPLRDPPPEEVPLKHAPLIRVIAQVRFPEVLSIEQREFVAPFQEAIRPDYPVLRQEQTQGVMFTPTGVQPVKPQVAWRFGEVEEGGWRVSLTPEFLALETGRYTSRADLLERLRKVLVHLQRHVDPKLMDRLGLRYIDRISGHSAVRQDIKRLVRAEVLGVTGVTQDEHVIHSLSETMFNVDGANILARSGRLPPNKTTDPAAIEPISEESFLLDLDMFSTKPSPFSVEHVVAEARRYAERLYTFFRWAVTEEFLRRYGGKP